MNFDAEHYYQAAGERMQQRRNIYHKGNSFALAMYCGGLAVECMLRAFRWLEDTSFSGRHVMETLLKASHLLAINEIEMHRKGVSHVETIGVSVQLRAAASEVFTLWHNNLRFASESRLRTFLNQIGRLHGKKGDALKANALDLLNAAQTLIDRGVALWNFAKKSKKR